jgi:hypothetical protein
MLAALVPVGFILVVSTLVRYEIISTTIWGIDLTPQAVIAVITTTVPVVQPYVEFVEMYLTSFFISLHSAARLGLDSYVTTVAFAYIGGVLSQQNRREMMLLTRMSRGNNTTVVLEGNTFAASPQERQVRRGSRGFEDLEMLNASHDDAVELPRTMRSARKALNQEEEPLPITAKDRKALRERAQSMAREQRGVERKVQRMATPGDRSDHRPSGDKKDWEFI